MPDPMQQTIRDGRRVTLVGVVVNALLIAFKLVGGWLGNSQAVVADAVHSISDFFTDVVVLIGLKVGGREADEGHPYGHARLETLAAAVVGFSLVAVAVYLGFGAGRSIYWHVDSRPNWLAALAAAVSIVAKEGLYQYTIIVGRRIKSASVQANAWHHRSDALSSVAVLAGVTGAIINPAWHILDAYAALLVSVLILKVGFDIIWNAVREFTDTAPSRDVLNQMEACARDVAGVLDVHDLKVRSSGGRFQAEIHVVVHGYLTVIEGHRIAKEVEQCMLSDMDDVVKVIVHVDPADPGHPPERRAEEPNGS